MSETKDVLILAIESSCDETAAAVVKNGREVLSNVISSQIALHTLYGGVVPEIASRKHIEKINQVIEEALKEAEVTLDDIDAIGVTYGPGLVGALLVGVAEAKAIAYAAGKPLVGVHHIEGHIAANFIEHKELEPPFFSLVVSGGHTHLVRVKDYGKFDIIGRSSHHKGIFSLRSDKLALLLIPITQILLWYTDRHFGRFTFLYMYPFKTMQLFKRHPDTSRRLVSPHRHHTSRYWKLQS
jgi:hypothetical protein